MSLNFLKKKFPKSKSVDIMLYSEGTFPYIRGGVSTWIEQLIKGMPQYTFGVCFIGAKRIMDGKPLKVHYEFPKNLIHIEEHYLFEDSERSLPSPRKGGKKGFQAIEELYKSFQTMSGASLKKSDIPEMLHDIDFYMKDVTFDDFLYSERSWDFINQKYLENCPDVPFIDYFWTVRGIHQPIWVLAKIVKNLPEIKIHHSPSTGYAGFLGALASYTTNKPFFITEHGIYTRERKIDMLSADWIENNKASLLQQPQMYNYIKKMWVTFFEKIGIFCYHRANSILSLYKGAQKLQVQFGADVNKTLVIPNGVDVDRLNLTIKERETTPKPIITLIGRVVPIKDIKTFIRAIKITQHYIPDVEGWIVGAVDEDSEYVLECQQMAISLGLKEKEQVFINNKSDMSQDEIIASSDAIKLFGHSDITTILPKTALMALSSISEGMPLVILEGFAAGVPCVATDVGSCKDLILGSINDEDVAIGHAGAVTGIANPEALAKEYIRFLNFASGDWEAAQKAALVRVEKYYRQEMFLGEYKKIYDAAKNLTWKEFVKVKTAFYMPKQAPLLPIVVKFFKIVKYTHSNKVP